MPLAVPPAAVGRSSREAPFPAPQSDTNRASYASVQIPNRVSFRCDGKGCERTRCEIFAEIPSSHTSRRRGSGSKCPTPRERIRVKYRHWIVTIRRVLAGRSRVPVCSRRGDARCAPPSLCAPACEARSPLPLRQFHSGAPDHPTTARRSALLPSEVFLPSPRLFPPTATLQIRSGPPLAEFQSRPAQAPHILHRAKLVLARLCTSWRRAARCAH
jgi:hypothetical protein